MPSKQALGLATLLGLMALPSCTSVDPGTNFIVPQVVFDANFFYCHVEPEMIFALSCGSGDPSQGDPPNGCHFNGSVVSGMALTNHPPVTCNGDIPADPTQIGTGSPAETNYGLVSLEFSKDYTTSALFTRPSSFNGQKPAAHPRAIFDQGDATINTLLSTWASK